MRQYEAVEIIVKAIIEDGLAETVYLKGSLARASEDEYSNIDLYAIVEEENLSSFRIKALNYLESYSSILHSRSFKNKIVCVYEVDLIVNLSFHTLTNLTYEDKIVVIYDPKKYLENYESLPAIYSPEEIGSLVEEMLFTALEFRKAYLRKDELYSFSLAGELLKYLGIIIRTKYDEENARLGFKNFEFEFDEEDIFREILKLYKLSSSLECVKMQLVLLDGYINNMPILLVEHINLDFYAFVKRKIMSID